MLVRTDATKHWLEEGFRKEGAGVTAKATRWLLDQGIKLTGIDSWTWDQPFDVMLKRENLKETFLESHKLGHKREYIHMETLANLDKIPKPFLVSRSLLFRSISKGRALRGFDRLPSLKIKGSRERIDDPVGCPSR